MQNPLNNNKFLISLVIVGILLLIQGINVITHIEKIEPVDISKYKIPTYPEWRIFPVNYTESDIVLDQGSEPKIIKNISITFKTLEIFAVNNPISVSVNVQVSNPEFVNSIGRVIFMTTSPKIDYSGLGNANLDDFLSRNEPKYVDLYSNGSDTYGTDAYGKDGYSITFYYTQDVGYILLILDKDNQHILGRIVNQNTIFSVSPYSDYLQTVVSKLDAEQIRQTNTVVENQQESNKIVEGLEWIIIGIIPIEFVITILISRKDKPVTFSSNIH